MAYYQGAAANITAVRTALIDACTGEGWTWNAAQEVLHKGDVYFQLPIVANCLRLQGRSSLTAGAAPQLVKIGAITIASAPALAWPLSYEVFVFEYEVYLVIQYAVDVYQWLAFGKSTVNGLPGTGAWFAGTSHGTSVSHTIGVGMSATGGGGSGSVICPGIFWTASGGADNYYVHSGLDGGEWAHATSGATPIGIASLAPLVGLLPNSWNSEAVLLPVRAYKLRASSKVSLIADLEHCRITRNLHLEPGQVITLGGDSWKVLPFLRKNAAAPNATNSDSGTFAMAIRYEGA